LVKDRYMVSLHLNTRVSSCGTFPAFYYPAVAFLVKQLM
jgi:hypothetical protein